MSGYEDGTFKADNNITRAEACKIVAKYMQGGEEESPTNLDEELEILNLINSTRIDNELTTLILSRDISTVSRNHAEDLGKNDSGG